LLPGRMRTLTLPSGRPLSIIEPLHDPSRRWSAHPMGTGYIVRRAGQGNSAWETVMGATSLTIRFTREDAEDLADLLNGA
jgi:hypothetical protein